MREISKSVTRLTEQAAGVVGDIQQVNRGPSRCRTAAGRSRNSWLTACGAVRRRLDSMSQGTTSELGNGKFVSVPANYHLAWFQKLDEPPAS
jgi:hypothetical protein